MNSLIIKTVAPVLMASALAASNLPGNLPLPVQPAAQQQVAKTMPQDLGVSFAGYEQNLSQYYSSPLFQSFQSNQPDERDFSLPGEEPAVQDNLFKPYTETVNGVKVVFVGKGISYPVENGYTGSIASAKVSDYIPLIKKYSAQYNLDPAIPAAIMMIESGGNPHAVSDKGALGIMQIMPDTASAWGLSDPFNPDENIKTAIEILSSYYRVYNGNLALVAAAYNAGSGAVGQYNGIPPYQETQSYVQAFRRWYDYYRNMLGESGV